MYRFKSHAKSLEFDVSPDGRKIRTQRLKEEETPGFSNSPLRTGQFDNQGSSQPWTWAWTTDTGPFEIWRPSGVCLRVASPGVLDLFRFRAVTVRAPLALWIGKTGFFSYGLVGQGSDGSTISLVKDTYPFWDANMNATYDGLSEDEDFFPHIMMGRELASRLKIAFDETIRP